MFEQHAIETMITFSGVNCVLAGSITTLIWTVCNAMTPHLPTRKSQTTYQKLYPECAAGTLRMETSFFAQLRFLEKGRLQRNLHFLLDGTVLNCFLKDVHDVLGHHLCNDLVLNKTLRIAFLWMNATAPTICSKTATSTLRCGTPLRRPSAHFLALGKDFKQPRQTRRSHVPDDQKVACPGARTLQQGTQQSKPHHQIYALENASLGSKTPNLKSVVFDRFGEVRFLMALLPSPDNPTDSLRRPKNAHDKKKLLFFLKNEVPSGDGPLVCTLSAQSSLPCSKLQLVKNIDLQSSGWSSSGGQFWWLSMALRLDLLTVGKERKTRPHPLWGSMEFHQKKVFL